MKTEKLRKFRSPFEKEQYLECPFYVIAGTGTALMIIAALILLLAYKNKDTVREFNDPIPVTMKIVGKCIEEDSKNNIKSYYYFYTKYKNSTFKIDVSEFNYITRHSGELVRFHINKIELNRYYIGEGDLIDIPFIADTGLFTVMIFSILSIMLMAFAIRFARDGIKEGTIFRHLVLGYLTISILSSVVIFICLIILFK